VLVTGTDTDCARDVDLKLFMQYADLYRFCSKLNLFVIFRKFPPFSHLFSLVFLHTFTMVYQMFMMLTPVLGRHDQLFVESCQITDEFHYYDDGLPDLQPRGLHDWHIRMLERSCQRGL